MMYHLDPSQQEAAIKLATTLDKDIEGVILQVCSVYGYDDEYQGADKSLARPTSWCCRTESIVLLEANLLLRSNNICMLQTVKNL